MTSPSSPPSTKASVDWLLSRNVLGLTPRNGLGTAAESKRMLGCGNVSFIAAIAGPMMEAANAAACRIELVAGAWVVRAYETHGDIELVPEVGGRSHDERDLVEVGDTRSVLRAQQGRGHEGSQHGIERPSFNCASLSVSKIDDAHADSYSQTLNS